MINLTDQQKFLLKEAIDPQSLLTFLGFKIFRVGHNEVRCACIIHGGDNQTSFRMSLEYKTWCCYSHKCEYSESGKNNNDVFGLVMKVKNCSFPEAANYLIDFSGISFESCSRDDYIYENKKDINNFIRTASKLSPSLGQLYLSEEQIELYKDRKIDYFLRQGFAKETLDYFEAGSKVDSAGVERATVPIRDDRGNLVSVSARRTDGDISPRYILDRDFKKGRVLYNLNNAKNSGSDVVIVVEGFKALWAVYEAGFPNVVATMGSNITEEQVFLLCRYNFSKCLLMFDGDRAGKVGANIAHSKLKNYFNTVVCELEEGLSPDDGSREDLKLFVELYLSYLS